MIERADFGKYVESSPWNLFGAALILTLVLGTGCTVFEAQEKSHAPPTEQSQSAKPGSEQGSSASSPQAQEDVSEKIFAEILSEQITFDSLGDTLVGVLDRPETRQTPGPAVLILHATGPHDRRGHFKTGLGIQLPVEVPVYENIAQNLARNGYLVMRYDKRTCVKGGRAWCTYPRSYVESQRQNLAQALEADASAALARLQSNPRVDPAQIYILGHDQGADLALAIAEKAQPAGLILLAPSPYPVDQIIAHQIDGSLKHLNKARETAGNTSDGALLDQQIAELIRTKERQAQDFAALRAGTFDADDLLGAPANTWSGFLQLHQRASAQLARHTTPTLAIFGSHDRVLPRESARAFREGARGAGGEDALLVEIVELAQITHFMVDIDPQASPSAVSERVQEQVLDFLEAQSKAGH